MNESNQLEPIPEGEIQISLFKNKEIRRVLHDGEWFFSVVDIIEAITDSIRPRQYWTDLKSKIIKEGANELYENIVQLKMLEQASRILNVSISHIRNLIRHKKIHYFTGPRKMYYVSLDDFKQEVASQ